MTMNLLPQWRAACLLILALGLNAEAARMNGKPDGLAAATAKTAIQWEEWSEEAFARAKRENRLILLDLEAVWCHWCHVMEETTYHDAKVAQVIGKHYIALKVDQDARPDLSRRYDEYGWPATVVFAPDGTEIVKRRGYIPPERMGRLLEAIVADPSPLKYLDQASIETYSDTHLLPGPVRKELAQRFEKSHDFKLGGLDQEQKYLDRDTVEYALVLARRGDAQARQIARQDLNGALGLIDPAWGGVYQYSTDRDWKHPHFEKLLQIQADYLRAYALGYMILGDPAYLKAAKEIHRYVTGFLMSPEGAFYVSQDADLVKGEHSGEYFSLDDASRRKLGMPAIDKHLYAREQGWMVQALVQLYSATLDEQYLRQAQSATEWTVKNRVLPEGGFRHDERAAAGPYLEDSLAMGRGLLALYSVTGDRQWLARAEDTARFVRKNFPTARGAGYATAADRGQVLKPKPQIDENIAAARFFNLAARYTGNPDYRADAERAMRYLVTREVALLRRTEAGILIADVELGKDPTHLTIVGKKDDPAAQGLFQAALRYPSAYRRIEWWDRREGPLPNPDVQYPEFPKAAAFVCTAGTCSLPQFDGKEMLALAARLEAAPR
jgi:uncharacterized protein YyaL (SSP411 family)